MKTYVELKTLIDQRGVHAVFGASGEGWGIEQNASELADFLVHMQELGVQSVLEIGTGYKAGLARFLHDDMGWWVVSIDIHDYGHQYGGIQFVTNPDYGSLHPQADLVLIDGDHSYEAVKRDHEVYAYAAAKVVAFHDIAGLRDCEGVKQYWDEIATQDKVYSSRPFKEGFYEIIADAPERGGIGYIVLAEAPTPEPPAKPKAAPRKRAPAKKPAAKPKATAKK